MLEERLLLPEDLLPGLDKLARVVLHLDPIQMRLQTVLGNAGDDALDHNANMPLQPGGILASSFSYSPILTIGIREGRTMWQNHLPQ